MKVPFISQMVFMPLAPASCPQLSFESRAPYSYFRETLLGPTGSALIQTAAVVATGGAVKSNGGIGAAYVSFGNRMSPRSFVALVPQSAMRAEPRWLNQAVADALVYEELTILSASWVTKE